MDFSRLIDIICDDKESDNIIQFTYCIAIVRFKTFKDITEDIDNCNEIHIPYPKQVVERFLEWCIEEETKDIKYIYDHNKKESYSIINVADYLNYDSLFANKRMLIDVYLHQYIENILKMPHIIYPKHFKDLECTKIKVDWITIKIVIDHIIDNLDKYKQLNAKL